MDLTKQTTELESIEDLEQTKPQTLGDVRNWLKRVGKDKEIVISPLIQSTNDFSEDGVYICNTENSTEMEFVKVRDGDVNNLVEMLYVFHDVNRDWKEYYKKPQTLGDIRGWIIRSEAGWVFEMSDEKVKGLSVGVEVRVPSNYKSTAEKFGIWMDETAFIPFEAESGKELDGIIKFFKFHGIKPDWDEKEEPEETDSEDFIISKPNSLYDVEDWIRRVDRPIYADLKLKDIDCRSYICTSVFLRNTFDNVYELIMNKHHASNDYDEVINFLSERFGIKKDWE